MGDKLANVLVTLAVAAIVTSLVLPGRQTPAVLREGLGGLADVTRASTGR